MNNLDETILDSIDTENDGYSHNMEESLCCNCEVNVRDKTENKDSILCADCRENFIRLHIPVWVIVFSVLVFAIFAGSIVHLPKTLESYKIYLEGNRQMQAKEYLFSYDSYSSLLNEYGDSIPIIINAADAAMHAQLFEDAAIILDTYLVGKSLDDEEYEHATEISDALERYYHSMDALTLILENAGLDGQSTNTAPPLEQIKELLSDEMNDKTIIYHYMGIFASTLEESLEYLRLAAEEDERYTYPLAIYGNVLRQAQRFDEARTIYQTAVEQNACDTSAITGLGILELLVGDKKQGLSMIQRAYEINPYDLYAPEAVIIALCENGLRDDALAIMEKKKSESYSFDPELESYLDGEIDLRQFYIY
ncbi:hypothetical protein V6615_01520 [Oscillospiraceae bacterium PP1C4]